MRLRIGAGVLVLALHAAVAAVIVLGTRPAPVAAENESAMMVSVIDAPAPRQAPPQTKPQPPTSTPVAAPPVETPPEPDAHARPEPTPEPAPIAHPSPLAPVIKPHPKPQPVRHPVPQAAATPTAPEPPAVNAPEGPQQTSQAPRQDQPVLVTNIEYDGPRPIPNYPRLSRLHNETGRVVVLVRISAQGQVQDARIDTSSGYERLDEAALDAARRARFKPFTRDSVAMPALARLPYDFQMKD